MWEFVQELNPKQALAELNDLRSAKRARDLDAAPLGDDSPGSRLNGIFAGTVGAAKTLAQGTVGAATSLAQGTVDLAQEKAKDLAQNTMDIAQGTVDVLSEQASQDDHLRRWLQVPEGQESSGGSKSEAAEAAMQPPLASSGAPAAATEADAPRSLASAGTGAAAGPAASLFKAATERIVTVGTAAAPKTADSSEVKRLQDALAAAQAQAQAAESGCSTLQASMLELTSASDEALQHHDEHQKQVVLLRRAVEEKDSTIVRLQGSQEQLDVERARAAARAAELELGLSAARQKERRLLDEVASLREMLASRERRLTQLVAERAVVDRRASGSVPAAEHEAMLQAHTAIARAFGDLSSENPLRCIDEPSLRLTTVFLKHPIFRRLFFFCSVVLWFFALFKAVAPLVDFHSVQV